MTKPSAPLSPELDDPEIGLEDVLNALRLSWRGILLGALLTPLLVAGAIKIFGKFSAEATLSNICIQQDLANKDKDKDKDKDKGLECALTFARWRMLAENLPGVAGQWAATLEGRGENPRPLGWLASAPWWEKQVVPVYGISQAETKKFPLMDEKLKAESTRISQIKITMTDRKVERAKEGLEWSLRFLRDGATYLELKNLLDGYQGEVAVLTAGFSGEQLRAEVESGYLKTRLKEFETLMERDKDLTSHDEVRVDVGTVDPSFLPLRTQANALKVSLYGLEEKLKRLKAEEEAVGVLEAFIGQAKAVMADQYQGQSGDTLTQGLFTIVEGLSAGVSVDDLPRQQAISRIRGDIARIQGRYSVQLPELSRRIEPPRVVIVALAGSVLGGAFLGFILAFGRHKLREYYAPSKRI
jgi:hypothetical protein